MKITSGVSFLQSDLYLACITIPLNFFYLANKCNMDWSELVPEIVKTPITLYKNRKLIQHWWIKLLAHIDKGDTDIVLLGRPSVGKTLMSKCLHGQAPDFSYKTPGQSPDVETEAIKMGEWTKLVRVIPGQSSKKRSSGLEEVFHSSKTLEGIIYVVDWGYSVPREETTREILIKEKGFDTISKIRARNLEEELIDIQDTMNKIVDLFANNRTLKWLIIVVNKVDLFYEDINNAQKYYSLDYNSEFTDIVKTALHQIGMQNLKVITQPMTSWQEDFEWNNEKLKTAIGGKKNEYGLSLNLISKIADLSNLE